MVERASVALLTTSLTAHYPLNETTGSTAADTTGNNNAATFTTPTPTPTAPWTTTGRISGAANLTGGSYLQIQPSASLNAITTAITVATWIRRDTNPVTGDQYIIYRRNATLGSVVHLLQTPTGNVCFAINSDQICDGTVPTAEWRHIAGTYDGSTKRLYVDGILRAQSPSTGTLTFQNGYSLYLGSNQGGAFPYNGQLDDARIYSRAITPDEAWKLAHPESIDCELAAAGTLCDDGNNCTTGETCQSGTCSATAATQTTCDAAFACACPSAKRAVVIVGNNTPLPADDTAIKTRLEAAGYGVQILRDRDALPHHAAGKDLVVFSETVSTANVTPTFATVATPIIILDPGLYDDFGMTPTGYGTGYGDTSTNRITITDPLHPLAAGQTGSLDIASTAQQIGWGVPTTTAVKIATLTSDATKAVVFGYHEGAQLINSTAPAKRVGFFARTGITPTLNTPARAMLDAAIAWADDDAPSVLLVTGAQNPAADVTLRTRLRNTLGYDVQQVDQYSTTVTHANPHRAVIVSETVSSSVITNMFAALAKPVMVLEGGIYNAMGMTGPSWNTHWGAVEAAAGQTTLAMQGTGHVLSAGIIGTPAVTTSPAKFVWGTPAASAIAIANIPTQPTRAAVFAYRQGAAMVTGTAPARRLGFFAGDMTPSVLNANGWKLFDAGIRWLVAPEKRVALVVASADALNTSDAAMRTRLLGLGYEVDVYSGPTVQPADVNGSAVVLISESVVSSTVGTRLTNIAVPIVSLEPALFDELGMTASAWTSSQGDALAQTAVNVTNAGHPLAAGLAAGTRTVLSSPEKMVWGSPGPNAVRIASIVGYPGQVAVFAYTAGAGMVTGTAVARRVGWFAGSTTPVVLNADGWRMFDAAIQWAASSSDACEQLNSGAACDDGNVCTTQDACVAGVCVGVPGNPVCQLVPYIACVDETASSRVALLGYSNPTGTTLTVPSGPSNALSSGVISGNAPTVFAPGVRQVAAQVAIAPTGAVSWTLGDDVVSTSNAPACCAGAPPATMSSGSTAAGAVVFQDNWERCADAWRDGTGAEASNTVLTDWATCRTDSGRVMTVSGTESHRSSWFNLIPVQPGNTYCLAAWINWVGGNQPYVDILRFDPYMTPVGARNVLIGSTVADGLGGNATPVATDNGFRRYHKTFAVPAGTAYVQIENGTRGVANKPGESVAYFDDVVITQGDCVL